VSSGGSFGASPLRQHVGLGRAQRVVAVDIRWPSGGAQRVTGMSPNQTVRSTEQADGYTVVPRMPLPLDRGRTGARATSR
jgi:hypothetical protein